MPRMVVFRYQNTDEFCFPYYYKTARETIVFSGALSQLFCCSRQRRSFCLCKDLQKFRCSAEILKPEDSFSPLMEKDIPVIFGYLPYNAARSTDGNNIGRNILSHNAS